MAYKKLADAMSGKAPPPPAKPAPAATNVVGNMPKPSAAPKSSVAARDGYAKAMNSGDRASAARFKAQMDAEEAAARGKK